MIIPESSKREIDIIIQKDGKVAPIEVKGGNARATSLQTIMKNSKDIPCVYKFADGNIGVSDDGIVLTEVYFLSALLKNYSFESAFFF